MNNPLSFCEEYIAPALICYEITNEGVLCSSPIDPGFGGNEDMEEGDEL